MSCALPSVFDMPLTVLHKHDGCQAFLCYNKAEYEVKPVVGAQSGEQARPPVIPPKGPNTLVAYIKRKLRERNAKKDKESPTDRAVRVTATATIWMAMFTFVLAFVGAVTLIEIVKGGQDTHDLAVAAGKQADKMKDMSDAADKIRQAAEDMAAQERILADNSRKELEASNRQSRQVLEESIATSHLDQRAWVAAANPSMEGIDVNATPKAKIVWFNSGKTIAKKFVALIHLRFSANLIGSEKELNQLSENGDSIGSLPVSVGTLAPQGRTESTISYPHKLSATDKSTLEATYTYLWGRALLC